MSVENKHERKKQVEKELIEISKRAGKLYAELRQLQAKEDPLRREIKRLEKELAEEDNVLQIKNWYLYTKGFNFRSSLVYVLSKSKKRKYTYYTCYVVTLISGVYFIHYLRFSLANLMTGWSPVNFSESDRLSVVMEYSFSPEKILEFAKASFSNRKPDPFKANDYLSSGNLQPVIYKEN